MNGYINECNYKDGWMLNIPPSYQKVKKKIQIVKKTKTKNEKGLEKLFATTLKLLVITLGFLGQNCLLPTSPSV
jgi:hypothetical protein